MKIHTQISYKYEIEELFKILGLEHEQKDVYTINYNEIDDKMYVYIEIVKEESVKDELE